VLSRKFFSLLRYTDYGTLRLGDCEVDWTGVDLVSLFFHPSGIRKMQGNLHIPSTWFLVLFNVLLFHSLQFVGIPDVFGLLIMFGMELEGYNFIHQWQDCCLLSDDRVLA